MPSAEVIKRALSLYQTELRKPSLTVYCLDYSGSMKGDGEKELKTAMATLLNQEEASEYMIQASKKDITIVIPFNEMIIDIWQVIGNEQDKMNLLFNEVNALQSRGGTDIYLAALQGIEIIKDKKYDSYSRAVVLLTDGESNEGFTFIDFKDIFNQYNMDIPVFSIVFGDASERKLKEISDLTKARVFDGKKDLIEAFKKAKGYN